jgi:hypothetical protein
LLTEEQRDDELEKEIKKVEKVKKKRLDGGFILRSIGFKSDIVKDENSDESEQSEEIMKFSDDNIDSEEINEDIESFKVDHGIKSIIIIIGIKLLLMLLYP